MNVLKRISTFLLFSIVLGACSDSPSFPNTPHIEFVSLTYVEGKSAFISDSLNLTIRFQDGDGDLGFENYNIDEPFHPLNFFLANNGEMEKVGTITRYHNLPPFINLHSGQQGKLATIRTRQEAGFGSLPPYTIPNNCINYIYDSIYISEEHKDFFDDTYQLIKVLTAPNYPKVYVLLDTFYCEVNPNFFNITVDFLVKQNDGSFEKFEWATEFCNYNSNAPEPSFNGRFPMITKKSGTYKYPMLSHIFKPVFSGKTLKLRVQIFDRAFNASNVIETPEFTLR